jgi:peroxiredoxin Q/BCP
MSTIALNQPAPEFSAQATSDQNISLSDLRGKNVVLYFYPKDNTPGCTKEGEGFRDHFAQFKKYHTVILGVSRDSLKAHENFKAKYEFPFDLLSDSEETLCQLYDVIKMKNLYGKQVRGIERSTFLIDATGVLREVWRKVKVPGHVEAVLAAVKKLSS